MNASTPLLLASLIISTVSTHAQIVVFSFNGSVGNELTLAPDSQPSFATVTSMSRGSGLTPASGADTFSASAWTTSSSLDLSDYFSFYISPNNGALMSLYNLTLDERRSASGIRDWSVRSSLDNFGTDLSHFSVPDDANTRTDQSTQLGTSFGNLLNGVEFRIYGYNSESGAGTWRIDNVRLAGNLSFSAVPEPREYALVVGAGLIAFAMVRKSKWGWRFGRMSS